MRGTGVQLLALAMLLGSGAALAHAGDDVDVARLGTAIDVAPTAQLYLQRAEKLRLMRRFDEAAADLGRAEKLGASTTDTALFHGLIFADRGNEDLALASLDRYFSAGGASSLALRTRARIQARRGRLDDAVNDLKRAVRQSADPEVCLELSDAEEARGRPEDAAAGLEQCLRALNGAVSVRKRLIEVCVRKRDFHRAAMLAREAMAGLPVKAEWRLIAADTFDAAGNKAEARRERTAAIDELDRVLATRGGGLHQVLRARALVGLGRRAEAQTQLDALLAERPDFEEAQQLRAQLGGRSEKGRPR